MEGIYYMKLYVNKGSSIKSIQNKFNEEYPFLKIEFFNNYSKRQPLPKATTLTLSESTKKLDGAYDGKIIDISETRKVLEVEQDLEKLFGFAALVFRRSGNVWVETCLTEDWTLEEQNWEGEQISSHFK